MLKMLKKINDAIAKGLLFFADCVYANAMLILFVLALSIPFILVFGLPSGD